MVLITILECVVYVSGRVVLKLMLLYGLFAVLKTT